MRSLKICEWRTLPSIETLELRKIKSKFSLIHIFYDISLSKTVEIEVISTGLYQKMVSSASGLVVGLIAFVAYHVINARIDKLAHRMEDTQIQFLDMLNEPSK